MPTDRDKKKGLLTDRQAERHANRLEHMPTDREETTGRHTDGYQLPYSDNIFGFHDPF